MHWQRNLQPSQGKCDCTYGWGARMPVPLFRGLNPEFVGLFTVVRAWTRQLHLERNQSTGGDWCHPHDPECSNPNSKSFIRCECRSDTRGKDSITCPKDPYGRICSNNGTATIMVYVSATPSRPVSLVSQRYLQALANHSSRNTPGSPLETFSQMTGADWSWTDGMILSGTFITMNTSASFSACRKASQNLINVFDPKTKAEIQS